MSEHLSENELFATVVKIIDPQAYDYWVLGSLDPGSLEDVQWNTAKLKSEAILRLFERTTAINLDAGPIKHRLCPFCGGRPRLVDPTYNGPADCWDTYIDCSECDARSAGVLREHGDDEDWSVSEAWEQWDRRAVDDSRLITSTADTFIKALNGVVDDAALARKLWTAILSVCGTSPVGWTSTDQLKGISEAPDHVVGSFWARSAQRKTLDDDDKRTAPGRLDHPLYAAPVFTFESPSIARRVKPLEWSVDSKDGDLTYNVTTIIGRYAVWMRKSDAHVLLPDAHRSKEVGDKIEDALQFAQNHFSNLINRQFL